MIPKNTLTGTFILCLLLLLTYRSGAQVTIAFQGGEPGDNWNYTSTLASAIATGEAQLAPNKVSGTTSIVVGGNTGGGSCFSGGSGNGPAVARTFTFNSVDISQSSDFARTLNFHWGNRFPTCNGTGWDAGENLVFTAYHDGVAQPSVTLVTGNNNAPYSIQANQYTWNIPACINSFSFVISVTTNRSDELLFLDNVRLTTPQLNGAANQPAPIAGAVSVCPGAVETYGTTAVTGTSYTWSGLPAGATFTTANGTTSGSITVDWGTAPAGTYTLSVVPASACSGTPGPAQTLTVTVEAAPVPLTISGPLTFCAGNSIVLSSNYPSGNSWSNGADTQSIDVFLGGTYTCTVQTACATVSGSVTVTAFDAPVISSVDATAVSCAGQNDGSLTVNATGNGLEYSLDGTTWQTSAVFTGLAQGNYTVAVRNADGCEAAASATISEPVPLTASAANDGPFCAGTPGTLHGTSNATGAVYSWTGPNGYASSVQDPADATAAGVYTLIVSLNGCTSPTAETTVEITAVPQAFASNGGAYCTGEAIQLNGATDLATPVIYSWTGPNGYVSTAEDPSDATLAGTYTLTTTNNGCSGTPATTTVVVNAIPNAAAAYNAPFCPGMPLELYGSTNASGATFSWTGPNAYASAAQNPLDATQAGTYMLLVTANGCTSPAAFTTVTAQVPEVSANNSGPACEGAPLQLSGYTNAASPVYSWTGPNGFASAIASPAGITAPGTYTLTVTANNCSATASTQVVVLPLPVAAFDPETLCVSEEGVFASQAGVAPPQTIQTSAWDFGDGSFSDQSSVTHAFADAGTYNVTLQVTTNAGCSASVTQAIAVSGRPVANFYFSPDVISDFDPTVQLVNASVFSDGYAWTFDGIGASAAESPSYTFPEAGDQHVVQLIAWNAAGCADTISKIVTTEHTTIYYVPNAFTPDGDEFNNLFKPVFTEGFDPNNYSLQVYNRWGEVIFESNDPETGWDGTYHGTLQTDGAYVWNIRFKHRETDAYEVVTGHVTMLH